MKLLPCSNVGLFAILFFFVGRNKMASFYVRGTMHRNSNVNNCPTRCNYTQFILSVNCSTCFGWFLHTSSGAQITVSTASGTGQTLLLPVAIVEELRLLLNSCIVASCWTIIDIRMASFLFSQTYSVRKSVERKRNVCY